jgi:two-component system, chemotaxis family, protein-glutamate methylesterase/glutaminase
VTREIDLVVIGGSAGAIDVLRQVLPRLTKAFRPTVAIVIHLPAEGPIMLHELLAGPGTPPMKVAEDKEPVVPGTIYFAPPDYHLLVERLPVEGRRTFALSIDARVHYVRPAIDVLFESAAEAFRERVMGIILSGANADGAAGLRAIADHGGMAVVQSLETAEMIAMPAAALQAVPQSMEVDVAALAELLRVHGEVNGG